MIKLNSNFRMNAKEFEFLASLPDNLPETKLTQKQKDGVNELYRRFITRNIDNQDWSKNLDNLEKGEKWPSGPRMKTHEARRIVIGHIETVNRWGDLTNKEASERFYNILKGIRLSFQTVVYYAYNSR